MVGSSTVGFRGFAAALVFLGVSALPAWSEVLLDFEDLTPPVPFLSSYEKDGFLLRTAEEGFGFQSFGPGDTFFYTGSTALALGTADTTAVLERPDGVPFNLLRIDLSKYFAWNDNPTVTFTGTKMDDTTVTESFTTTSSDGVIALETFTFSAAFSDLKEVRWTQLSPFHQFDNIVLTVVPEPTAALLLGLGVPLGAGLLGRIRSRRHRAES